MNEVIVAIAVMAVVTMFYIMHMRIKYLEKIAEIRTKRFELAIERVNNRIDFEENQRIIGDNLNSIKNGQNEMDILDLQYEMSISKEDIYDIVVEVINDMEQRNKRFEW